MSCIIDENNELNLSNKHIVEHKDFDLYDEGVDSDYYSDVFILVALSMLESRNYSGLTALMMYLDNPKQIIDLIKIFSGSKIEFPTAKDFALDLKTAVYAFKCILGKNLYPFSQQNKDDFTEIRNRYEQWLTWMRSEGIDPVRFFKENVKSNIIYKYKRK